MKITLKKFYSKNPLINKADRAAMYDVICAFIVGDKAAIN